MYAALALALFAAFEPASAADRSSLPRLSKPVAAGAPWTPAEVAALRASLDALLAGAPALRGAPAGAIALATRSGAVLYERNADEHFLPASSAKLATGSVALARLGAGFRFTTEVLGTGPVADGELQGDLVLRGGGDPLLAANDLESAASAVANAGIRSVAGTVRTDSSYFAPKRYGDGWSVDDIPFYYMPVVSALSLEENVLHLTVTAGANVGDPAGLRAAPASAVHPPPAEGCPNGELGFFLVNRATTGARGSRDTADVAREPCGAMVVTGEIPLGAPPDEIDAAVPNPEGYSADVFRAALAARGVRIASPAAAAADGASGRYRPLDASWSVLWRHDSEPLSELLADFWYPSDNLIGEALLRVLGVARDGPPGTEAAGLALVRETLAAGVPAHGFELVDGSGLSRYDLATPRALASVLQADWNASYRDVVLDALPVAGVRGSLAHEFAGTPLERRIFAKSGSMTHVSALAGYLATNRHGAVTFAIMVDDWSGDAAALEELRTRWLSRLAAE